MGFKKTLNNLSNSMELIIILIIGFGFPLFFSTFSLLGLSSEYNQSWLIRLTSQGFYIIVAHEIIALIVILYILKVRGMNFKTFDFGFSFRLILVALLLVFVSYILRGFLYMVLKLTELLPETFVNNTHNNLQVNWISLALVTIINSFYEEFILIGYIFKRLEKYHPAIIIGLSLLIRESYHTYQGWISLLVIIPMGLIFGLYYYRYKKLWPVIMAHGFSNLFTFWSMEI